MKRRDCGRKSARIHDTLDQRPVYGHFRPVTRLSLRSSALAALPPLALAVALTVVFWRPLWTGGGLIGGDIYYYFLPQKVAYAEALQRGEWPIWNNRQGLGYPTVGESQTGVFYPLHLILYGLLPVGRAYAASMLLHYVLTFLTAWLFARRVGLSSLAALLTALVYTYGWFAPRISLEWTILGGAWLTLALWLVESFLQTGRWRHVFFLAIVLAVQILPGHFVMAFLTQLAVLGWVTLRLVFQAVRREPVAWRAAGGIGLALAMGFALSAIQLVPTWELKQLSQRQTVTQEHDPGYGYLPPKYLLQAVAPWYWYAGDAPLKSAMTGTSRTNRVEAHLYFGLAPLLLAVWGTVTALRNPPELERSETPVSGDTRSTSPDTPRGFALLQPRPPPRNLAILCLVLGTAATVYATGCLIPLTQHLPGFSFFEGPGRYGVITTLMVGLLAGLGLDHLLPRRNRSNQWVLTSLLFVGTTADLWLVQRTVAHAVVVETAPIDALPHSELRRRFLDHPQPVRVLSPASNAGTLLGISVWPPYLGLSPAAYFDPQRKLPDPIPYETRPTPEQIAWLRRAGVTHLLLLPPRANIASRVSIEELWRDADGEPAVRFVTSQADPVLNPVLDVQGALRVYELLGTRGRVAYEQGTAKVASISPTRVEIDADGPGGTVVLTELLYPGWQVTIDNEPAAPREVEGLFRGVDVPTGKHRIVWMYRPMSLVWGAVISALPLVAWLVCGHVCFWYRRCW